MLRVVRLLGGFALARRVTRQQLRILCFHGFSVRQEYETAPYVFMRAATFRRRMEALRRLRIPVVSLEDGLERLRQGRLNDAETVITFDDGWTTNLTIGAPILREFGYPATVYITTEHLDCGPESFYMAVARMVYESPEEFATFEGIHPLLDGRYDLKADPASTAHQLVVASSKVGPLRAQYPLLRPIAAALGIDYEAFFADGRFRLLEAEQVRELAKTGMRVELHTHTHSLPEDSFESAALEIENNRSAITQLTGTVPRHFCYPSGQYFQKHPEWLARLGVASATTCDPGLNGPQTPLLLLRRHLDSEFYSDIEFEAELVGLLELMRRARAKLLKQAPRAGSAATAHTG